MTNKSNLDKEILVVLFYLNNSKLKMYKNRLQTILKITNRQLNLNEINIDKTIDLLIEKNIIVYKYNDFGKYYLPKVKIKLEDYSTELLDKLHKLNYKFKNKTYKEIKELEEKGYF